MSGRPTFEELAEDEGRRLPSRLTWLRDHPDHVYLYPEGVDPFDHEVARSAHALRERTRLLTRTQTGEWPTEEALDGRVAPVLEEWRRVYGPGYADLPARPGTRPASLGEDDGGD